MSIHVIGVNFRSSHMLGPYLADLARQELDSLTCTIVDNSSDGDEWRAVETICRRYAWVDCILAPANLGYIGGFRLGLQTAQPHSSWVVMSNLDLAFSPGALSALEKFPDRGVGIVGPDLTDQVSRRSLNPFLRTRPSRREMRRLRATFYFLWVARLYVYLSHRLRRRAVSKANVEPQLVYAVHGSFLAFSPSYLALRGAFDFPGFLFGEEIFLAEMCRRANLKVIFHPGMRGMHLGHVSTGRWRSREILMHQRRSLAVCWELLGFREGQRHLW